MPTTGPASTVMRDEEPAAGKRIGRFRLVRRLGSGGTGDVWLAEDEIHPRSVAIKLPHHDLLTTDRMRRDFLREARTGSMLDHPGIATVHDVGDSLFGPFIAMAYVDGPSLRAVLAGGVPPHADAVGWIAEAADALAHAHAHRIVHGDISPGNVMLDADGRVRIVDFGLARSLLGPSDSTHSKGRGTYPYMAPEVLRGAHPDPLADIYALGAVLYQLLTGELPYEGRSPGAYIRAAIEGNLRDPWRFDVRITPAVRATLLRALASPPSDRPAGAAALARELRSALLAPDDGTRPDSLTRESVEHPTPDCPATPESSDRLETKDLSTRAVLEARLLQARAYLRRPDQEASIDAAIAVLEPLRKIEPKHVEILATLARAALLKSRLTQDASWEDRAVDLIGRARAVDSLHPDVTLAGADLDCVQGRQEGALEGYRSVLSREPSSLSALLGLSVANERLGNRSAAEAAARSAIDAAPLDWRGYRQLGRILLNAGECRNALEPCRRVVELSPDHALGWSNYGSILFQLENFEDALEAYERSIALQPTAVGSFNAGTTLYYLGRYDESLEHYQQALALNASDPRAWGNFGIACRAIEGSRERSRVALERAIVLMREHVERHSDDANGFAWLAYWLAETGCLEEARAARDRALALAPDRRHTLPAMAGTYELLGDDETAIEIYLERVRSGSGLRAFETDPALARLRATPAWRRVTEENERRRAGGGAAG